MWAGGAERRVNKRKIADSDRFEPYSNMMFKRRAVSPTASVGSPALGSPVLGHTSFPTAPPLPITIPSPTPSTAVTHTTFFSYVNGHPTRAASPVLTSAANTSLNGVVKGFGTGANGSAHPTSASGTLGLMLGRESARDMRDDDERAERAGDTFSSMSLS